MSGWFPRRTVAGAAVLVAGLPLAACEIPYDPRIVSIEATARTYVAGDSVRVRLINISGEELVYSRCEVFLERKDLTPSVRFLTVAPAADPNCAGSSTPLAAGQSDSVTFRLAADLPSGIYRYRFDALYRGQELLPLGDRASHTFGVQLP
ncbi:MAG: hypothetical protein ACREN5_10285 [Gemmatimonadales bacterium]